MGTHGSGKVLLRSAPPGTGIIAGGPIRTVFEALGVHDVVAKSIGTTNPHNMVRATFDALAKLDDIKTIAERRGKKITDLYFKKKENAGRALKCKQVKDSERTDVEMINHYAATRRAYVRRSITFEVS